MKYNYVERITLMKIGIDARAAKWYRGTGIGTYAYQLLNSLNKIDSENDYLLFMPEKCSTDICFQKNFSVNNISEKLTGNFWDEINIPNILTDKDIEIYHVPHNGVGLPKQKNCSFIITLHDVIPYRMPETASDRLLKIFNEEMPGMVAMSDGIITVSEYSKLDIMKAFNYPKEKIFVTPLASEDIYFPMDKSLCKQLVKNNYGIDKDFILYVGGFSPRKNIMGLIDAFSKLSLKHPDLRLVIVGTKGKSYDDYRHRSLKLHIEDKVLFPGFIPVEHMPFFYNAASVFAYPSFYEGFGLPPLEAMACGVPVLASHSTSIPEVVGDGAILFDPLDTNEMFVLMDNMLEDTELRQDLISRGLARASQFSWEKTARKTLEAYLKSVN